MRGAEVADQMVYNAVREGTAAQRVSIQSRHGMRNTHLMRAIAAKGHAQGGRGGLRGQRFSFAVFRDFGQVTP